MSEATVINEGLEEALCITWPTRKGLTLRPETWAELLPIIQRQMAAGGRSG